MQKSEELNIYKLELKIEKLKQLSTRIDNQIKLLIQDIDRKNELIKILQDRKIKSKLKKEIEETKKSLEKNRLKSARLDMVIKQYEVRVKILKTDDLLKNDEISLVNNSGSLEGKYNIYRNEDYRKVGYITFSPEYLDLDIGSVGYAVFPQFRGKQYAYKSLCLLSDYLSNNGVNRISLVADIDNTSSIRIMEKFCDKADAIDQTDNKKTIVRYSYKLKNRGKE